MKKEDIIADLTDKQKAFCEEYCIDWNGRRAYLAAYPNVTQNTAGVNANKLLKNTKVQQYCKIIQSNIEKRCGISRMKVLQEYMKIGFSSVAHLHNKWIERKDFESLTDDQKSCISEIDVKVQKKNIGSKDEPEIINIEHVKIKLYDKMKALDSISKMLGYNEEVEVNVNMTRPIQIVSASEYMKSIEDAEVID